MTDNEIIKEYNGLTPRQQLTLFRNLYYNDGYATERGVIANAINDILPEYNRQKAEIARLKDMVGQNEGVLPQYENLIKAEAIKEFAERLKATPCRFREERTIYFDKPPITKMVLFVDDNDIDNLAKELTEEQP